MSVCWTLPGAPGGLSSSSSSIANPNRILSGTALPYGHSYGRLRPPLLPLPPPSTPLKKTKKKEDGSRGTLPSFFVSSSSSSSSGSPPPSPSSSPSPSPSPFPSSSLPPSPPQGGSVWDSNAENVRWSPRRAPKPPWDDNGGGDSDIGSEEKQKKAEKKRKKMEWDFDSPASARNGTEEPSLSPEDWRWWRSPPDDDEYQMENGFRERNDGFPWMEFDVKQAISTLSWMFPAAVVLFPWLMGNPMLMMMGFAIFPVAKRVVPGAFKLFSMFFGPPPKPKRRRRRNSSNATFNRSPIWRDKFYEDPRSANGFDEDGIFYPEESSEAPFDQPNDRGLKRSATGGWEDLNERSSPRQAEENLVEFKRSSGMRRTPRKRQVPLLLRLLVALFPFLRSWGGFL